MATRAYDSAQRKAKSRQLKTALAYHKLATDGGVLPLEVLVLNMRKAWAKALEIERQSVQENRPELEDEAWKHRREAHEFAISAAPYMHSKLATLELTGEGGGPIQTEEVTRPKLSKDEWLAAHGVGAVGVTDVTPKET